MSDDIKPVPDDAEAFPEGYVDPRIGASDVDVKPGMNIPPRLVDAACSVPSRVHHEYVAKRQRDKLQRDLDDAKVVQYRIAVRQDIDASIAVISSELVGTKPLADAQLDEIPYLITLMKPLDPEQVPVEVRFVVPDVDLSTDGLDPLKVVTRIECFVHLDGMPPELRDVVKAYKRLTRASSSFDLNHAINDFKCAAARLASSAEKMVEVEPVTGSDTMPI